MLRRTRNTVRQAGEFDPNCMSDTTLLDEMAAHPEGTGVFSRVFDRLRDLKKGTNNHMATSFRLTVVGHSMGAIVLDEIITAYPNLGYDDIVYMGAAASVTDVSRSVTGALRQNPKARFFNLMLHPQAEAHEINYGATVPSGSLLKWIDEIYGEPLTPRDKTAGVWGNVRAAKMAFPADIQERLIFKVFGLEDYDPLMHGDFSKKCFWDPNFWVSTDLVDRI